MAMKTCETMVPVATRPDGSRFWHKVADIVFIISTGTGAIPVAKFGNDYITLLMFFEFNLILIFILGLRGFAAVLLDAKITSDEPPRWLTLTKSSLAVAIFLSLLFGAAVAISWLSVSDPVRVMLLFGAVAALWALMRRLGRGVLAEKPAAPNEGDSTMMEGRN